jgi:hypothetical protein
MILFTILGVIFGVISTVILAYPRLYPEDERVGRRVGPRGIQEAINRIGEPYFWTDKKIYALGLTVAAIAATFAVVGIVTG